jgi:hypothetical protein
MEIQKLAQIVLDGYVLRFVPFLSLPLFVFFHFTLVRLLVFTVSLALIFPILLATARLFFIELRASARRFLLSEPFAPRTVHANPVLTYILFG